MPCNEYAIEGSDEYFDGFVSLREGHQRRVQRFLESHARSSPTHGPYPGWKALRGAQAGIYQFMVSNAEGLRLLYVVDEEHCVVRLEYLGTHPTWSKSRDRGSLQNF